MKVVSMDSAKPPFPRARHDEWPAADTESPAEKRIAPRIPASEMPAVTGVRLMPDDVDASLVNISTTGILVECTARPRPGTTLTVHFSGPGMLPPVQGRVVRALVACLGADGLLRYQLGIAFNAPIEIERLTGAGDADSSARAATPSDSAGQKPVERRNRW